MSDDAVVTQNTHVTEDKVSEASTDTKPTNTSDDVLTVLYKIKNTIVSCTLAILISMVSVICYFVFGAPRRTIDVNVNTPNRECSHTLPETDMYVQPMDATPALNQGEIPLSQAGINSALLQIAAQQSADSQELFSAHQETREVSVQAFKRGVENKNKIEQLEKDFQWFKKYAQLK